MRLIGLILSLAAIVWVLFQASGGKDSEDIIPEGHKQAMQKAESVEQTLQNTAQQRLQELDERNQ
ncbi:MAG: hypothetical protein OEV47_19120 [Gammaproteobacteria bacterium]|nr:hypothetical protein [Gammaproteobacteria bacterium]